MNKKISSLVLWILILTFFFVSGCGLDPNYKNCVNAIKNSWSLYNPDVVWFHVKDWYLKEYPAKIVVWTNIWHYDIDIPWEASVACIASNPWKIKDNWGYNYEIVLIQWKDPTFTQNEINNIYFLRKEFNDPSLLQHVIDEFWSDGLRFKILESNTNLTLDML